MMSKTKRVQFHIDWAKYREVDLMAKEKGMSVDNMARVALYQYMVRNSARGKKGSNDD